MGIKYLPSCTVLSAPHALSNFILKQLWKQSHIAKGEEISLSEVHRERTSLGKVIEHVRACDYVLFLFLKDSKKWKNHPKYDEVV